MLKIHQEWNPACLLLIWKWVWKHSLHPDWITLTFTLQYCQYFFLWLLLLGLVLGPEHGSRNYLWQFCNSVLSPAPKSQQAFWISAGIDWKIGLIIHKGSDLRSVNTRLLETLAAPLGQWVVRFFSLKTELKVMPFFFTPSYADCILRSALRGKVSCCLCAGFT